MGQPAVLVENVLSFMQFPLHTISTTDGNLVGASGFDVFHVANGRRAPNDCYRADAANAPRQLRAACDQPRWINGLCLDRGYNVAGATISVLGSYDAWTTPFTIWTGTVPTVLTSPGQLDNTNGVVTEEGAFLVRFPGNGAPYLGLSVPALGAGITLQLVGAWLGMWYSLPHLEPPWGDDAGDIMSAETTSTAGWIGSTAPVHRGQGVIRLQELSMADEPLLRLPIAGHWLDRRRPMWFVQDDAQAERAMLILRQKGVTGLGYEAGWAYRQGGLPYFEHEPVRGGG